MKKYFIFAFAALTSVVMFSCKEKTTPGGGETPENPGETTDLQVVLNVHELELAVGGQEKLRAAVKPAKDGITISFKSDNEAVATIDNSGVVTAVASGSANIIASADGAKADTCVVKVIEQADAFKWAGCLLWDLDKTQILSTDTTEVKLSNGLVVNCISVWSQYRIWSEGLAFTGNNLTGEGYMAILDVPTWLITDSLDDKGRNYYYVGSSLEIVPFEEYDPTKAENANTIPAGKLVSLEQQLTWFNDETGEELPGIEGAYLYYADFANERFYPFEALLGTGIYDGDDKEIYYRSNVAWSEGAYGLAITIDADGKAALKEPAEWATFTNSYYEKLPENTETTGVAEAKVPVLHREDALDRAIRTRSLEKFYMAR
jgi:hypothetical protein